MKSIVKPGQRRVGVRRDVDLCVRRIDAGSLHRHAPAVHPTNHFIGERAENSESQGEESLPDCPYANDDAQDQR